MVMDRKGFKMDTIDVKWLNDEQNIIHYHFQKGWQWSDLDDAFKAAWNLMDTVMHKVDVILDFTESTMSVPSGALTHGRRIFSNKPHSNLRLTVLVGNRFISQLTETARKFLPKGLDQWDLRFAASFEQAQGMIQERSLQEGQVETGQDDIAPKVDVAQAATVQDDGMSEVDDTQTATSTTAEAKAETTEQILTTTESKAEAAPKKQESEEASK
jgi:hypothetical protein